MCDWEYALGIFLLFFSSLKHLTTNFPCRSVSEIKKIVLFDPLYCGANGKLANWRDPKARAVGGRLIKTYTYPFDKTDI